MRTKNKVLVAIIILLILLLIAGGALAYVYMATDLLKSDQELFFEYFAQINSDDGFIDKRIETYNQKKEQNAYETSGEIAFELEYPENEYLNDKIIEKVNDLSIRFSGVTDLSNQKVEQDIEIDYGNDVIFPVKYRQDGNEFGLQFDEISKKFIAIRNENLDELIEKFTGENLEDEMAMEELTEMTESMQFTEDEMTQLKQIYGTVLQDELTDENFSRTKTEQGESYSLEIKAEQIKNIIIKMLEATKQNSLIIDKINEIIVEIDPDVEEIDVSQIDTIIETIDEEDFSEMSSIKIILTQSEGILKQITIEYEESKIVIAKNSTEDILSYEINCENKVAEEQENSDEDVMTQSNTLTAINDMGESIIESIKPSFYINVKYSGLKELKNIQENYEIGYQIDSEDIAMKSDYKINSDTQFIDSVSIEELDNNNTVFLNDHDAEVITNFMSQVGTRLLEVNKNQMEQLGLEQHENPILYSNPVTLLISMNLMVYNMASETIDNTENLNGYVMQQHNDKFERYVGEGITGTTVNAMLKTVFNHNISEGEEGIRVQVTGDATLAVDAEEQPEKVSTDITYDVETIYDDNGYITEIKVTAQN